MDGHDDASDPAAAGAPPTHDDEAGKLHEHDHADAAHDLLLMTHVHKHADAWRHNALFANRVSDPDAPSREDLPGAPSSEASNDMELANKAGE
jgi:hypothetical protein